MANPDLRNINVYSRTPITSIHDSYTVSPMREVVLKTQLHCGCEGCFKNLATTLFKIKGVQHAEVYVEEKLIKVQGTMDTEELSALLRKKLNLKVEVVRLHPQPSSVNGIKDDKGETNEQTQKAH